MAGKEALWQGLHGRRPQHLYYRRKRRDREGYAQCQAGYQCGGSSGVGGTVKSQLRSKAIKRISISNNIYCSFDMLLIIEGGSCYERLS